MDKDKLFTEYNNLQVIDSMDLKESKNGYKTFKGLVLFKDKNGKVIDIKENLILYETRIHAMRNFFEYKKTGTTTTFNFVCKPRAMFALWQNASLRQFNSKLWN